MKKLLEFHNAWLPLIIFIICLSSIFMYGFTFKALINLIILVYCTVIVVCANKYQEILEAKEKKYKECIKKLLDEKNSKQQNVDRKK